MAEQQSVKGYVVIARNGEFLTRSMRWIEHRNTRQATSLQQAYVHPVQDIISGGKWVSRVAEVQAATYDGSNQFTDVTGSPIPFESFLDRHQTGRPV